MVEKYPTDSSMVCKKKNWRKTKELETQISTINKEITNLCVEIITKYQILLISKINSSQLPSMKLLKKYLVMCLSRIARNVASRHQKLKFFGFILKTTTIMSSSVSTVIIDTCWNTARKCTKGKFITREN